MNFHIKNKRIYGWTKVQESGKIILPITAVNEYNLIPQHSVIINYAINSSEGIGITSRSLLENSSLSFIITDYPELINKTKTEKKPVMINQKYYCRLTLRKDLSINLPPVLLTRYRLNAGDFLLVTADSGFAVGLIVQGSIINEVKKYPDLPVFS